MIKELERKANFLMGSVRASNASLPKRDLGSMTIDDLYDLIEWLEKQMNPHPEK